MYIPSNSARERRTWTHSIFCVRLLQVCSFFYDGQFQSLQVWDEQQVRLSRFFINPSTATEGSPAGNFINMINYNKSIAWVLLIIFVCSHYTLKAESLSVWVGESVKLSCPPTIFTIGWTDYNTLSINWSIPNSNDSDKLSLSRTTAKNITVNANYYFEGKVRVQVVHHVMASKIIGKVESHKPMDFTTNFYISCKKPKFQLFPRNFLLLLATNITSNMHSNTQMPAQVLLSHLNRMIQALLMLAGTVLLWQKSEEQQKIIATTNFNTTASCIVHVVPVDVTAVVFHETSLDVYPDQIISLSPEIYPSNATNKQLQWSSTNNEVATVDGNGVVHTYNPGLSEIKATSTAGAFGCCYINVLPPYNSGMDIIGDGNLVELTDSNLLIKDGVYAIYNMLGQIVYQGCGPAQVQLQPAQSYILVINGESVKLMTK